MSNVVSENLQSMFSKMENFISTKTVVGEAIHFDGVIIVPLVEVTFGVGSGLGEGKDETTGGGGALGARMTPVAVIVIMNGTAQLIDVKSQQSVNKLIDMIPGVLSKFDIGSLFSKKDKAEKPEGSVPPEREQNEI